MRVIYSIIHKLQYIIHALQLHYSNNSVVLSVNYRCIIVHYLKQRWGICHYVTLSVLQEVTVGHIGRGRLHVTKYVFPDVCGLSTCSQAHSQGCFQVYRQLHYMIHSQPTWLSASMFTLKRQDTSNFSWLYAPMYA